jgi:hypothetical protein
MEDELTRRKILLTLPDQGCDLCGERAGLLELIGSKDGRTWVCPICKKKTDIYLYTTPDGRELLNKIITLSNKAEERREERKERVIDKAVKIVKEEHEQGKKSQ